MEKLTGAELVEAARAGDEAALAALLREYLPLVYNVVGRALHGHSDVDDVVQETMLRVVQRLPELRDPERFRSWVIAIAIRQVHEHGRDRNASLNRHRPLEAADAPDPSADVVTPTLARLEVSALRRDLLDAGRWLGDEDRRLLALWWQESAGLLNRAEVAQSLSLSPPHTAVRIQRMKANLELARKVLRAFQARPRCTGLAEAARGWDGAADPRWLRRLGRHVRGCEQCQRAATPHAPPEKLLAGVGMLMFPLRRVWRALSAKPALVTGTVVAGTTTALLLAVYYPSGPQHEVALPPGPSATGHNQPTRPAVAAAASTPAATSTPTAGVFTGVVEADYYVAPDGSDAAAGTRAAPFATLGKAASVVRPGQTIALRGGVYRPSEPIRIQTSGTAQKRIVVSNYRNERPVIDASRVPPDQWYVTQQASYWTVQGLEITGAVNHPYVCLSCRYDVFARLSFHDNAETGLLLRGADTTGNQVLDSDFFANHDTGDNGGTADGLAFKYGSGAGNLIRGCRMYHNSADGLDLSDFSEPVTIERSWSFGNGVNRWDIPGFVAGGNGFKLGGGDTGLSAGHIVRDSAAWDNAGYGFTEAGNQGPLLLANDTAYRNRKAGFAFVASHSTLTRNLALANARESWLGEQVTVDNNSWDQPAWDTTTLRSGDPSTAQAPRQPDGSLPTTTFLLNRRDPSIGAAMVG
jgi:RNA polymerase sigma factor (sigma-70 family)